MLTTRVSQPIFDWLCLTAQERQTSISNVVRGALLAEYKRGRS